MAVRLSQSEAASLGLSSPRKRPARAKAPKAGEDTFVRLCEAHGLPRPEPEHKFHPTRKWRLDWAWLERKIALEIDGGAWSRGRHTRGKGFIADQTKRNEAQLLGWMVLHCTPQDVKTGKVFELLRRAFRL